MEKQTLETVALLKEDYSLIATMEDVGLAAGKFEMCVKNLDGLETLICTSNGQTFDTMMLPLNVSWEVRRR